MCGVLEWEEPDGGILHASAHAYAALVAFWRDSDYPHLLRIWNYFDAITLGEGDSERYRQFCVGRVQGLGDVDTRTLPAATAIGSRDGRRVLQVYWLAAREPGLPLENPRQVSAYRYPREYGPQSPTFARALLPPSPRVPLLLSGTASIVGHASQHADSLRAQLDETLTNLDSLLGAARERAPMLSPHLDGTSRLKVYVRGAADADAVAAQLEARLGTRVPWLMLHADVCRRELLVEIEGMHGVGA
jgi:chorismate lyase/3-hydroxybenzoate synthase